MEIQDELAALRAQLDSIRGQLSLLLARPQEKPLPRLLSSREVMNMLGYTETGPFLEAARKAGCPIVTINARKILFDQEDLRTWLEKRKNPAVVQRVRIICGSGSRKRRPSVRQAGGVAHAPRSGIGDA